MRPRIEHLSDIHDAIWRELQRAALDRHHAWRTPVLATVDDREPQARTVVLREVHVERHQLVIYTDARAGKVAQLRVQPVAMIVMWSPALHWQLRLQVRVQVHDQGLATTSRWARLQHSPAAHDYLAPSAPGSVIEGLAANAAGASTSPNDPPIIPPAAGPAHFAVIEAEVVWLDWLELHPQGHRRARFEGDRSQWLQP